MSSNPDISSIVAHIVEAVHPTRIYLFGSHANGTAHSDSDVDIYVLYDGKLELHEAQRIASRALIDRDFALDLIVTSTFKFERYKHVVNTLAMEVNEKGVLIYG